MQEMSSKHWKSQSNEVKVYVRVRPTNHYTPDFIEYLPHLQTVNIRHKRDPKKGLVNNQLCSWSFRLDGVLHNASQEDVYNRVAHSVVMGALEGYNGTVMCFGHTGAGKTYTMTGATEDYKKRGIIPRALQEVFHEVAQRIDRTFSVHVSYLEIYNETLGDLLASVEGGWVTQSGALTVVDEPGGGVTVKGLSLHTIQSEGEAMNLLFEGEMNRIIGEHTLNKNSSRSHCIFTVHIESCSRIRTNGRYVMSKLNLVDLAGSERSSKFCCKGQMRKETGYINKSLTFLEQTILALADQRREHVPFRQSKLTHVLKDSLGGNCNTVLVANIYAEVAHTEETLSTLRFAARMKCVPTDPSINEHTDPILQVKRLKKEIEHLRQELSLHISRTGIEYEQMSENQAAVINSQLQRYLAGSLDEVETLSVKNMKETCATFKKAVLEQVQQLMEKMFHKNMGSHGERARSKVIAAVKGAEKLKRGSSSKEGHRGQEEGSSRTKVLTPAQKPKTPEPQILVIEEAKKRTEIPSKKEAFALFKAEQGSRIYQILKENQAALQKQQNLLIQLTKLINLAKHEMKQLSSELKLCQEKKEGLGVSTDKKTEWDLTLEFREAKDRYKKVFEKQLYTKAEVNYCHHLVNKCHERLVTEFESWYSHAFLGSEAQSTKAH